MSVIRWENPPESQHGKWKRTADLLAEKPGEWALVAEGCTEGRAYYSVARCLRKYGCVVKIRKMSGEGYSVWATVVDNSKSVV